MAALSIGIPSTNFAAHTSTPRTRRFPSTWIPKIYCVQSDPNGSFKSPPPTGDIYESDILRLLKQNAESRLAFERHMREERDRQRVLREARAVRETDAEMIEYFLDTEAQEIHRFEIAGVEMEDGRVRARFTEAYFSQLQSEAAETQETEDRLIELEELKKIVLDAAVTEEDHKMLSELIKTKKSLFKIFTSKDIEATLLEMNEQNEINRALLTLLDEKIAIAHQDNQKPVVEFMEKHRAAVLKYITV
ncbi:hypothetical protein Dimus_008884 [Dionaea muscipula]